MSGIPGGYRLVSTYDLPDCKTILKFEIWSFSELGGGILKLSDLDSLTIFIWGGILKLSDLDSVTIFIFGGYSETLGFGLSDNFHWGVFWNSWIWTLWQFLFWGGILKLSDLDSLTIFILGGYSETLWQFSLGGVFWNSQIWTLWQFSFGGGDSVFQNRGILPEFGPKFQTLQQAHASQIVSHILRMWRLIR